jgi:hypothetical protein
LNTLETLGDYRSPKLTLDSSITTENVNQEGLSFDSYIGTWELTHCFESVELISPVIQNNLLNMESNDNPSRKSFFLHFMECACWPRAYELEGLILISSVSVEVL